MLRNTTAAAILVATALAACGGGGSKPLSNRDYRTVDVHAQNGRAMVQRFQSENNQQWLTHVAEYVNRCVVPGLPEGTQLLTNNAAAGKRTAYVFTLGKVGENGKIDGFENLFYQVEYHMGNNSVVVVDRGQPAVPGVAAATQLTLGLTSQLKRRLLPLGACKA